MFRSPKPFDREVTPKAFDGTTVQQRLDEIISSGATPWAATLPDASLVMAPYRSREQPVYRLIIGEPIPSATRNAFPEKHFPWDPSACISGSRGFMDFKVCVDPEGLMVQAIGIEPSSRRQGLMHACLDIAEQLSRDLNLPHLVADFPMHYFIESKLARRGFSQQPYRPGVWVKEMVSAVLPKPL